MSQGTDTTTHTQPTDTTIIDDMSITLSVVLVLTIFYILRFIPLPVNSEMLTWIFIAKATPSPGWILAPLLHVGVTHYVANVGQLLYFGVVPDRLLHRREYLGFLLVSGVTPILVQVLIYNLQGIEGGLVGASGATMAVMGFTTAHLVLYRLGRVQNPGVSNEFNIRTTILVMGIVWTGTQLISDFYHGWSIAPEASGAAHLSGLLLGIGYAIVRSRGSMLAE